MPKLIAPDGSQLKLEGNEVTVGRSDGSESVAPDLDLGALERGRTVSRRHARIFRQRTGWRLKVEPTAMNETRVGGRQLRPGEETALTDGDEIQLGAVSLTFRTDVDPDATLVGRALAPAELRVDALVIPLAAPEGRRLWIGRRSADAGSHPEIDLTDVPGSRSVSHRHAQVYRTADGWMLHEGETTNPTLVAGRQLDRGEDVRLTDGVSIQLGRLLVTFHEVRQARVVTSDILLLEVDQQELEVNPGGERSLDIRLVNATGRVEQVQVEVEGIPADWYRIAQPDGTRSAVWRVQLVPTGPDPMNPLPNSYASATLVVAPPRVPASRAGMYPITVAATTQGEDRVRRVVPGRVRVLPFEGMELTLWPSEARGASAKYTAEVVNSGNVDAVVELSTEVDKGLTVTIEPPRLQLANGGDQRCLVKARVPHHWWGPKRTYGFHVTAVSGTQRSVGNSLLECSPIVPVWLQEVLSKLFTIFSPIAIPAATLLLLLGLAYLVLRPPDIKEFYAEPSAAVAGTPVKLNWQVDRVASMTVEPQIEGKPEGGKGILVVSPDVTTEYTLTARNWIGISSNQKTTVNVLKIVAFRATPDRIAREGQEVTLHWETVGASGVTIDPGAEIKDPKPSGDATVHPTATTTYKLVANAPGVTAESQAAVAIGAPTIKRFEVTSPPAGARVFAGDPVTLNWVADGATKATLTTNKGDVVPGKKELDVSNGPPVTVRPAASGDIEYTLTVSNAAGSQKMPMKVAVTSVAVTQFESAPSTITRGQQSTLRWRVEGANDTTSITIEPDVGKVEPAGDRAVTPTDTTEYLLTVKGAGGEPIERRTIVTVKGPLPQIDVFTAASASVTRGETVRLTWRVQNADFVEIRTGDNRLIIHSEDPNGNVSHVPQGPTTYVLEATGSSGRVTRDFSVDVKEPPTPAPPSSAPPAGGAPPAVQPPVSPGGNGVPPASP